MITRDESAQSLWIVQHSHVLKNLKYRDSRVEELGSNRMNGLCGQSGSFRAKMYQATGDIGLDCLSVSLHRNDDAIISTKYLAQRGWDLWGISRTTHVCSAGRQYLRPTHREHSD
ncbi:hypothetical protein [Luteococcus japonicus]|uniref:hypothetical protein n=1 Tax=Luteococcus japonicus TaxID=33984 RepID=UPI00117CFA84|nr:hypothetical protein [Luteococcus japonicus]